MLKIKHYKITLKIPSVFFSHLFKSSISFSQKMTRIIIHEKKHILVEKLKNTYLITLNGLRVLGPHNNHDNKWLISLSSNKTTFTTRDVSSTYPCCFMLQPWDTNISEHNDYAVPDENVKNKQQQKTHANIIDYAPYQRLVCVLFIIICHLTCRVPQPLTSWCIYKSN